MHYHPIYECPYLVRPDKQKSEELRHIFLQFLTWTRLISMHRMMYFTSLLSKSRTKDSAIWFEDRTSNEHLLEFNAYIH